MPHDIEDDFLDGCDIDFAAEAENAETTELRPLFPHDDNETEIASEWRSLFGAPEGRLLARAAPLTARAYEFSGGGYDTDLLRRLRLFGLRVIEVDGWRTRGSTSFYPKGSIDHHTAGGRSGNAPSLGICIRGRSDLPGPLCTALQARDNTIYLIAAGRANHAGSGGYQGLAGNSSVYGLERENVGTGSEPWHPESFETAARFHAACLFGNKNAAARFVCRHAEWTRRKIDSVATSGDAMRGRVAVLLSTPAPTPPAPTPAPFQEELMYDKMAPSGEVGFALTHDKAQRLTMFTDSFGIGGRGAGVVVRALVRKSDGNWHALAGNPQDPGMTYVAAGRPWVIDLAPTDQAVVLSRPRDDATTAKLIVSVMLYPR